MSSVESAVLQVKAPYFDAEADVVPFFFLWPPAHTSSCWDARDLPCIDIDHKWGEITGIEIFQAAEVAFPAGEVPQFGHLSRDVDERGRPRWFLGLCEADPVRVSEATTSDENWLIRAHWDASDRLIQLTVIRLRQIDYDG